MTPAPMHARSTRRNNRTVAGGTAPRVRRRSHATETVVCILPAVDHHARSYGVTGQPMTRSLGLSWTCRRPLEPQAQRAFHTQMRFPATTGWLDAL